MSKDPWVYRSLRKALIVTAAGAFFAVGSGCDPTVRSTVLSGFQGLATSLVTALFQGIANSGSNTNTTTGTVGGSTDTST